MRKIVLIAVVILLFLLISPWAMGIYIERLYPSVFKVYETSGFTVKIIQYHRGWFCSDAKILVQIQQSDLRSFLDELKLPNEYEFQGHIQHGPIIYRPLHGLSTLFGLASIRNTSPTQNLEIADFMGFTAKHYNQIILTKIHLKYPNSLIQIALDRGESGIWLNEDLKKLHGEWHIDRLTIADDVASISLPEVIFEFDQYGPNDYYLLGNNHLHIPIVEWKEVDGKFLKVIDFKTSGYVEEKESTFSVNRQFDFQKLLIDGYSFGPMGFEITGKKINAEAVKNLFQSYLDISERGELYQSQLKQKMWMIIPTIVIQDTEIQLNHLNITTPNGKFSLQGKIQWPDPYVPEDISELLQSMNANADLQISKKILDQWLIYAAHMPYFNQPTEELENAYWDTRNEMFRNMRLNAFLISSMTDEGLIADADALDLLQLQKEYATLESYQNFLQKLYLNKNILRETNYRLFVQYLAIERSLQILMDITKTQKQDTLQGMKLQWKDWVKGGYIKDVGEGYTISIVQKDGKLVVSGKEVD
jgi:hypothetical protein